MSKENRKFSVPYNNSDPEDYISRVLTPNLNYVENVFFSPIFLVANHQVGLSMLTKDYKMSFGANSDRVLRELFDKENKTKEFMKLSKGLTKRIITLNAGHYDFSDIEMKAFVHSKLRPLIEDYEIDGFICTDFNMARYIHKLWPGLELHTSCNCFQWNVRQMHIWQEEAGISVFNPPREILRSPGKLKEMHDEGFKLKCLCNEACLYGCPNTVNHCMNVALGSKPFDGLCDRNQPVNFFKANWILPRWLPKLDPYVDIYKISGRMASTDYIQYTLKAYINEEDDIDLLKIVIGGTRMGIAAEISSIPCNMIHDKLLVCECRECNNNCIECLKLYNKLIRNNKFLDNNRLT